MHRSAAFMLVLFFAATSARLTSSSAKTVPKTTPDPDDEIDQVRRPLGRNSKWWWINLCNCFLKGDPFQYSYAVEAESNANSTRVEQSKAETSDGQEVVGQYKVLLPDGRLQTVTYTSGPGGYKATVKYVQVRTDSSTETSGRSFTPVRTSSPSTTSTRSPATRPPTTTRPPITTRPPTTTTNNPSVVASFDDESVETANAQPQRQPEPIDGRTSTSSRSRQRSNRTRGERFRSPLEQQVVGQSDDVTATTTSTTTAFVENIRTFKSASADSTITRSRPAAPVLKTTWRFDGRRQRPEEVFSLDYDN